MEKQRKLTKKLLNKLTYEITGAAIEVHRILCPGLLESNYEKAMIHELNLRGMKTKSQQKILVPYKDILLDCEMRYDILVEDSIVVENKSKKEIPPVDIAKLLTYMKHLKVPKGIMFNFHVTKLYPEGQNTYVNDYYRDLSDE